MPFIELGESIPPETAHAVSVSLPTWNSNVGYEEGEQWVLGRMVTGYPRFYVHKSIEAFAQDIVAQFGRPNQRAMLFPTKKTASRCMGFLAEKAPHDLLQDLQVIHLVLDPSKDVPEFLQAVRPAISAVLCSQEAYPYAKQYWQHSGDGVSSRRAEFSHGLFKDGMLIMEKAAQPVVPKSPKSARGPRRYQRSASTDLTHDTPDVGKLRSEQAEALESSRFLEERYGRNLDVSLVNNATSAIKRRIAGILTTENDLCAKATPFINENAARRVPDLKETDIYLTPCGMNAIFTAHQILLRAHEPRQSINFGFPYIDTLKILQKFGPGCIFYGHASDADLDDLENRLKNGEKFLGLFVEFPGNPLLTCADLHRIRRLADTYDFAVIIDETVGTFMNINILPLADVVVSSLTKIFSGDCNVMGGSMVLNPGSKYYTAMKRVSDAEFEDTYWAEDIIFMERNSRDFISRSKRVNVNAEAIADLLHDHPLVNKVYYPKYNDTKTYYDACRTPDGGYSGLISCTFQNKSQAMAFYDALETAKGPSLGTNFTLTSPYVLLAHYQELDWAASFGVDPSLLRISIGLEETEDLKAIFVTALKAAETAATQE